MPDKAPSLQQQALAVVENRIAPEKRLAFAEYVERRQSKFKSEPVEIEEFLTSKAYLGKEGEIYPRVLEALYKLLSGPYQEAVLTGAIGTAKTTIAVYAWLGDSINSLFCATRIGNLVSILRLKSSSFFSH